MESCDYFKELASRFVKFRETEFLCDTVLVTDDKELKAHSVLLAAASPIFRNTFEASGEPGLHYINLPGYNSTVVEIALHCIYTGDLVFPEQFKDSCSFLELFTSLQNLGLEPSCLRECEHVQIKEEWCHSTMDQLAGSPNNTSGSVNGIENHSTAVDECTNGDNIGVPVANFSQTAGCHVSQIKQEYPCETPETATAFSESTSLVVLSSQPTTVEFTPVENRQNTSCNALMRSQQNQNALHLHHSPNTGKTTLQSGYVKTVAGTRSPMKPFGCIYCNKTFKHPNNLEVHRRIHTGEKPFVCTHCGRHFSQRANLNRHVLGHSGEKPNLCHICGKAFIQKTQLEDHLSQHTDDLSFSCQICPVAFKDRVALRQHIVQDHQGNESKTPDRDVDAKPNVCETCGKSYSTIGGLRMHARIHSGQVVTCTVCSKVFVNRALLLQHLRGHVKDKAYECTVCGKAFVYKNALTVHARVHTGEKPYKCTVCGNSYAQFGHLQSHKKTHTGEKPFICNICSKAYRQKVDLRFHMNRVHKDGTVVKSEMVQNVK